MSQPCEFLDWDTGFFGVRIARVTGHRLDSDAVRDILAWCHDHEIACLYFLADSDHRETVRLSEDAGFRLIDIRLTFRHSHPQQAAAGEESIRLRPAMPGDLPTLQALARTGFRDSRYYYDPCFPVERCDALYETWITRSCEEGYADAVLVADLESMPIGYITCHLSEDNNHGQIGLVGVAPSAQGRGVGRLLVEQSLGWFARHGGEQVDVVTQGRNIAAQRLYQRAGFVTQAAQLWYHKWFTDCE
jgi:dTDP-4-amino-4,6-dideoxy-D-galactose acyltransferase